MTYRTTTVTTPPEPGTPPRWARSPWVRLPVMFLLMLVAYVLGQNVWYLVVDVNPVLGLVTGLVLAVAVLWAYRGLTTWLERRRRPDELALGRAAAGLGWGALLGFTLMSVVIGTIFLLGGYRVTGTGSIPGAVAMFGLMWFVGAGEELIFRGAVFRLVEERAGTWPALLVSAVFFGAIHLLNPGATLWGALAIAIEAGVLLGALYVTTRSLWPVIGLHFAWNFAESSIFGADVSGGSATDTVWTGVFDGPTLLTGGEFGPEASLVAIVVCLVPAVVLLVVAHRRGRFVQAARRRRFTARTTRHTPADG